MSVGEFLGLALVPGTPFGRGAEMRSQESAEELIRSEGRRSGAVGA